MAAGAQGVRAGRAFVELGANDASMRAAINAVSAKFKAWGDQVVGMGKIMAGLGTAAAGALGGTVMLFQSMGDAMAKAAQRTGVNVERLSGLAYAADLSAASFEDLENGIRKMQLTIAKAIGGSKEAIDTLRQIGVTADDLKGMTPDKQLALFAEKLSEINDQGVKVPLTTAIFGKSATKLIPLLNEGAAGMEKMIDQAGRLGLVMGKEDAAAAEELNDRMGELWSVLKYTAFTIGAALAPAVTDMVSSLTQGIATVKKFISDHRQLVTTVALGVTAFTAMGVGLVVAGFALQGIGVSLGAITGVMGIASRSVGLFLAPLKLLGPVAVGSFGILKAGVMRILPILTKIGGATLFLLNPFKLLPALAGVVTGAFSTAFSAIGTAIAAVGSMLGAVFSVAGATVLVGAAVVGIAGYFIYTSGVAGKAFAAIKGFATSAAGSVGRVFTSLWQRLQGIWSNIRTDVGVAFQGVRDAIVSGNWAMAAQIIWTTLKLEFNRGMQGFWDPMVIAFYGVKAALQNAWAATVASLQSTWSYAKQYLTSWDGVKTAAQKFFNWITNAWSAAIAYLDDMFTNWMVSSQQAEEDANNRRVMKAAGKSDADIEKEIQRQHDMAAGYIRKTRSDRDAQRSGTYADKQKKLDDDFRQSQPEAAAEGEAARLRIEEERMRQEAENAKMMANAIRGIDPARAASIDALQKELASLTGKASEERKRFEAQQQERKQQADDVSDESDRISEKAFETTGTFNKSALFGLSGAGGEAVRTAKATEKTAAVLERMERTRAKPATFT